MRPTYATINLDHIVSNYQKLRALLKPETKFCAVIKSNAYGHGSVRLAHVYEKLGVDYFAVATVEESIELRKAQIHQPILILGYIFPEDFETCLHHQIDISINDIETARKLSEKAKTLQKTANIHIKLDTGMSRIGFQCTKESVKQINEIAQLPYVNLVGLYTHFARADERDLTTTHEQFRRYQQMVSELEKLGIHFAIQHVCNSAATIVAPQYHLDMVRIGISLYGHYPSKEVDHQLISLKPAMSLITHVSHAKPLEIDRGVSYGHTFRTDQPIFLHTLPIGYADGFSRLLSNVADVFIDDARGRIRGRICMDQSLAEFDALYPIGTKVTIFSDDPEKCIERLAEQIGTIQYELLCLVHRRVPRIYYQRGNIVHADDYLIQQVRLNDKVE